MHGSESACLSVGWPVHVLRAGLGAVPCLSLFLPPEHDMRRPISTGLLELRRQSTIGQPAQGIPRPDRAAVWTACRHRVPATLRILSRPPSEGPLISERMLRHSRRMHGTAFAAARQARRIRCETPQVFWSPWPSAACSLPPARTPRLLPLARRAKMVVPKAGTTKMATLVAWEHARPVPRLQATALMDSFQARVPVAVAPRAPPRQTGKTVPTLRQAPRIPKATSPGRSAAGLWLLVQPGSSAPKGGPSGGTPSRTLAPTRRHPTPPRPMPSREAEATTCSDGSSM